MSHPNTSFRRKPRQHEVLPDCFYSVCYPSPLFHFDGDEGTDITSNNSMDCCRYGSCANCGSLSLLFCMNTSSEERWNVVAFLFTRLLSALL